jgi:hypothetical protein
MATAKAAQAWRLDATRVTIKRIASVKDMAIKSSKRS